MDGQNALEYKCFALTTEFLIFFVEQTILKNFLQKVNPNNTTLFLLFQRLQCPCCTHST